MTSLLLPYLTHEAEKTFSGEPFLFRLLHHPAFENNPADLARLLLHRRALVGRKSVETFPLRGLIENSLLLQTTDLQKPDSLTRSAQLITEWIAQFQNGTLPEAHLLLPETPNLANNSSPVLITLPASHLYVKYLRQMSLSVSTLNKFLHCRLKFYYENILKVTVSEPLQFRFGTVIHTVLENLYRHRKTAGAWLPVAVQQQEFETLMEGYRPALEMAGVWESQLKRGRHIIDRYSAEMIPTAHIDADIEYSVPRVLFENRIPMSGRIDKLEYYPDGAKVVDYKTGDPNSAFRKAGSPSPENPDGGDYWRQMVFYKLLVETATGGRGTVKAGAVEFLEREDELPLRVEWPLTETDATAVKQQVKDAWRKIQEGQFDSGCGRSTCEWCRMVRASGSRDV